MAERAVLGIKGLKMRSYSNADYYVAYEKKQKTCIQYEMMKTKIKE